MSRREDRVALQQKDDGDPGDEVYIAIGHSGTHRALTYHNSKDCLRSSGKTDEQIVAKERAFVRRGSKAPCKDCVIGGGD